MSDKRVVTEEARKPQRQERIDESARALVQQVHAAERRIAQAKATRAQAKAPPPKPVAKAKPKG